MTDPVYANTSSSEGAKVTQQFVNNYPDMDALIVAGGGGDPLVGSIGQLANMGLTRHHPRRLHRLPRGPQGAARDRRHVC